MDAERTVCVLGGGVIGLSTGLRLLQTCGSSVSVTLVAENLGSETTSDGSGGFWEPYKLSNTPDDLVARWGAATFRHFESLFFSPEAAAAGIQLVTAYQLWTHRDQPDPPWASVVPHFRHLSPAELQRFHHSQAVFRFVDAWEFSSVTAEQRLYLAWLTERFLAAGGRLQKRRVGQLAELAGYDVVVNCTGLGARTLFGDESMFPVRGQVIRVHAPWIKANYMVNEEFYVVPNTSNVVLGGTQQVGDWDTAVRPADRDRIWAAVRSLHPSLAAATVQREWVGLRPGRPSVRLEAEQLRVSTSGGETITLQVVHNYGHGGGGVTLSWGCAGDAVALVQQLLGLEVTSKL